MIAVRRQANKIETQQRRDWVVRELAASRPRHEIAQVMRSEWGLSDSQVSRYLKRGQEELIAAVGATDRVQLMAQLIASMQMVMRRSIAHRVAAPQKKRTSDLIFGGLASCSAGSTCG